MRRLKCASVFLFIFLFYGQAIAQDPLFVQGIDFSAGSGSHSVFASDFDGDGDFDLAVANDLSSNVSVLRNNGNATFQAAVNYTVGGQPRSVYSSDFDGDGFYDLAATSAASAQVFVLINNGDGTFQAAVGYNAGAGPRSVFSSDFNSDGDNDLAVANDGSGNVSILLNNGDGTFQSASNYPVGSYPSSVFSADFDNDHDNDLAVANYFSDSISILLNNGDGTFQAAINYDAIYGYFSLFSVDFDGDNDNDLAVSNADSNIVSIYLNNGVGVFQRSNNYDVGNIPYSIFAADLDNDGDNDIAVTDVGSNNVSILLNNGDATFRDSVNFITGSSPYSVFAADLDMDSDKDLAIARYDGSNNILINTTIQIDSGLVAYWPMDESMGDTVFDASGNNHNGSVFEANRVQGFSGNGLEFDNLNDYVEVSNNDSAFSIIGPWTLAAWVYPYSSGSDFRNDPIIWKISHDSSNADNYCLGMDSNNIFVVGIEDQTGPEHYLYSSSHSPDSWYHVVGLYDNDFLKIFVNGIIEDSASYGSFTAFHGPAPLRIGNILHSNHAYKGVFDGIIDEARVYNRALSSEEIQYLYELDEPKGKILVYGTYDGGVPYYSSAYYDDDLPAILNSHGYYVNVSDRSTAGPITDSMLAIYDQIWILNTDSDLDSCFSQDEITRLLNFRNSGKGLFLAADHYGEGHYYQADVNQVSAPLGLTFYGFTNHGNYEPIAPYFEVHPLFNGVTTIVGDPSEGKMNIGSLPELVAIYAGDSLIAALDDGNGRVVFDVSFTRLFDDSTGGHNWITQGDTEQYFKNIADWLMGTSPEKSLWIVDDDGIIGDSCDCNEIQACIDSSSSGDTVLVYSGNYQKINFDGKNIVVGSRYLTTGDTAYISSTIIDGGSSGSVVKFENGEGNSARICGFTITNGTAPSGGGIYCYQSSPTIDHNYIKNNTTTLTSTPDGGGVYCQESDATIEYNQISDNASTYGGGICCNTDCAPTITNNIIYACTSSTAGGGICLAHGTFGDVEYNLIYNNHSNNLGGGIYSHGTSANIFNNTMVGNSAANTGGGILSNGSLDTLTVVNTLLWENTAPTGPQAYPMSGTINVTYSDIEGGYTGEGNIDCDPLFCEPDSGNYQLAANSCCSGAGQGGSDIGALGVGCDSIYFGSIEGTVIDANITDSIESVIVMVEGFGMADTTDSTGYYFIDSLGIGSYDISFSHPFYEDTIVSSVSITANDTTTLDVEMTPIELTVHVGGDIFTMGDTWGDGDPDEYPVHQVVLSDFYLGKYEVTQKEWREITGNNPSLYQGNYNPVERVSWGSATTFCNRKSDEEDLDSCYTWSNDTIFCDFSKNGYRLPTEAEWEYAAKGGRFSHGYKFSGSDNADEVAWYNVNSDSTKQVGLLDPNELGFYDLSGNVAEFCWDWHYEPYDSGTVINPRGPATGDNGRVLRSGAWYSVLSTCRVAARGNINVSQSTPWVGLRLCRSVPGYSAIAGIVTEPDSVTPISGVEVYLQGTGITDITDSLGQYYLGDVDTGTYDIQFSHFLYRDTTITAIQVISDNINYQTTTLFPDTISQYWWPMFRHDLNHTGYSTSEAPDTNELSWSFTAGDYVFAPPAVAYGRVYFGSGDNNVYCLDSASGDSIWSFSTGDDIQYCPAVNDGKVYIGSFDYKIYCLDAYTGDSIWCFTTGGPVASAAAVAYGKVYIGSYDHKVYCLDAITGDSIWCFVTGNIVSSSAAVTNGKVYIGSGDHKLYCLDATSGDSIWSHSTHGAVHSSPAINDGKVYVGSFDQKVYCLDIFSGDTVWTYTTNGAVHSAPAIANGKLYVGSGDNKVYCLDASNGSELWQYETNDDVSSSPAIADNKLFVGSLDSTFYCLNDTTGELIWSYKTNSHVRSSPAIADGKVYVGSDDAKVYCFGSVENEIIGSLAGVITDSQTAEFIEDAIVTIEGLGIADTTDSLGYYYIDSLGIGNYDISFSHPFYEDTIASSVSITANDTTTLDVEMTPVELMVHVEGDIFTMGDTWGDGGEDERPAHQVALSSYYMGMYEVTQKEWFEITSDTPSSFIGNLRPVEQISWYDVIEFCNARSASEELDSCYTTVNDTVYCDFNANGYRIPTEAEWEFAAKGGISSQGFKYSGGNNADDVGWYTVNSGGSTHRIGQKLSNELGLFDMSGNVVEWCWDIHDSSYYESSPFINPVGPDDGTNRARRGGHWNGDLWRMRISDRWFNTPGTTLNTAGVRLCRSDAGYSAIAGIVTEPDSVTPISGVEVFLQGTGITDMTDSLGQYYLGDVDAGSYDISFSHAAYESLTVSGVVVTESDIARQDAIMGYLPPVLALSSAPNFGDTAFFPLSGDENKTFEFRINYGDPGNNPPQSDYPQMLFDWDGNGIIDHANDDTLQMAPSEADSIYSDGVDHSVFLTIPSGGNPQVRFEAYSVTGESDFYPDTGWIAGPEIFDEYSSDLYIYADDITFSTDPGMPEVGENIVISCKIHNNSPIAYDSVKVNLYVDGELADSFFIDLPAADINGIPGQGNVSIDTAFNEVAYLEIKFRVDPDSLISEFSESNNAAARSLVIGDYNLTANIHIDANALGSYYPSTQLGGSGSAWYEEEGAFIEYVSGAPAYLRLLEGNVDLGAFYVNDFGSFYYTFVSPSETGTYNLEITITDFTLTSTVIVPFEVIPAPGPDLVIDFDLGGLPLNECDNNILYVNSPRVRNAGMQAADTSRAIIIAGIDTLDFEVPPLNPGQNYVYSGNLTRTHTTEGDFSVLGIADVDNDVAEEVEGNNSRTKSYKVWCCPQDLSPVDLKMNTTPYAGCSVNIQAKIYNYGGQSANNFSLLFEDIHQGITDTIGVLANLSLPAYSVYNWFTFSGYTPPETGNHLIKVTADPYNTFQECSEDNNIYSETFYVGTAEPDLYTGYQYITVDNPDAAEGDTVTLRALVGNSTCASAGSFDVRFLLDSQQYDLDVSVLSLDAFSDTLISHPEPWVVDYGRCSLEVSVDPDNFINEINEGNNDGQVYTPYDFATYYRSKCSNYSWLQPRFFNMCSATTSDLVEINVSIKNAGLFNYNDSLQVIVFDSLSGGTDNVPFDTVYIPGPFLHHNSNAVSDIVAHQFTEAGIHFVTLKLNSDSSAAECNFANNEAKYSIEVFGLLPDLVVQSEWINVSSINPDSGDILYIEGVDIHNFGDTTAFDIDVFVEFDSDTLGNLLFIDSIASGEYRSVIPNDSVTVDSCYPRLHIFQVTADPSEMINERIEDNNSATRSIIYCDAPDLYVDTIYFEPTCDLIDDSLNIIAVIGNSGGAAASGKIEFRYLLNPEDWGDSVYIGHVYIQDVLPGTDTTTAVIVWDMAVDSTYIHVRITDIYPDDYNLSNNDESMYFFCRPYGELSGCVTDTSGAAIESVLVQIDDGIALHVEKNGNKANYPEILQRSFVSENDLQSVVVDSLYTDSNGCFSLTVPGGSYNLILNHEDYFDTTLFGLEVISGDITDTSIVLTPLPGFLQGTVTDVATGDSLEGIIVEIVGHSRYDTTDALGFYFFDSLAIGNYDGVLFYHEDYESLIAFDVGITPGDTTELNVSLVKLQGLLSGTVVDTSGIPIAGVMVELDDGIILFSESRGKLSEQMIAEKIGDKPSGEMTDSIIDTVYTDSSGYFEFTADSGTYSCSLSHEDYYGITTPDTAVTPGDTTHLDIILTPLPGNLGGTVTDAADYPIEGVVIELVGQSNRDTTDSFGYYFFGSLAVGTIDSISFSHQNYWDTAIVNVPISPGDTTVRDIQMFSARCDYVVGDVNGSGSYNGLDITYGVNFFKGGADPLCDTCLMCPDWWYCGDVNGSCNYNGLDITYGVSYFKGGSGPIPCSDCPPAGVFTIMREKPIEIKPGKSK